ncbi:MAG: hypothetical protein ABI895_42025 [Deltaproteobacteria bacterium]
MGNRQLREVAGDCHQLDEAVVLAIALIIDPSLPFAPPPAPSPARAAATPAADNPCECTFNANCLNPHICVDAARFPVEDDCAVATANCQDLAFFPGNSAPDPDGDPKSELAKARATCHEAVQARATEINCRRISWPQATY